jgi:site-specific recombinase
MLLHWTVATKQPAMTAPAHGRQASRCWPAAPARRPRWREAQAISGFVDEVVHLIRSQVAGIVGNLALCAPLVLARAGGRLALAGAPLVGAASADTCCTRPDPARADGAVRGLHRRAAVRQLLIAGWTENWFVYHRLDSAIAWNPRIVALLGRAARSALVGLVAGQRLGPGGQHLAGPDAGPGAGDADFLGLP